MSYISPNELAKAKEIDLLTYLSANNPNNLVKLSNSTYCTREHDSLKISNSKWYWWSRGFGGKSALDYLIKVKGLSFTEAVSEVLNSDGSVSYETRITTQQKHKTFTLQKAYKDNNRVIDYLLSRGIHKSIIDYCIDEGKLYESEKYHSCIFVGYDENGKARYATQRGTSGNYHGDIEGSDKSCSFSFVNRNSSTLFVFEAAIDLLSFATMRLYSFGEWTDDNYLSLSGVYKKKGINSDPPLPIALEAFLKNNPQVQTINLCLDNDEVGIGACKFITEKLKMDYTVNTMLPKLKDYNDELVNLSCNKRHINCIVR